MTSDDFQQPARPSDRPPPDTSVPPGSAPPETVLPPGSVGGSPRHDLRDTFAAGQAADPAHVPESAAAGPARLSPRDRFRQAVGGSGSDDIEEEQSLWEGAYSPRAMLGTALLLAVLSVAGIVTSVLYQIPPLKIGLAIIAVAWLWLAAVYGVRRLSIHYELTTQRFIHQTGLITRRTDRVEVIDIDDVSVFQGPVERLLGIGTIDITSSDRSHPHILMPGIPEVRKVASVIDDVRRRERKRRSLHIQTM